MEKRELEELVKLLKENNKHLENITARLDKIESALQKVRNVKPQKRSSMFDL